MSCRALFLDRDGVINEDKGYVCRPEEFRFIDGVFDLVALAKSLGYLVVVVTNQAGIGRGYYTEEDFHRLMDWVRSCFERRSGALDAVYFCPDHPLYGVGIYKRESPYRKPAPGMLQRAFRELNIDPSQSLLIGDKMTDIGAGQAAGLGMSILFRPESAEQYWPAISHLSEAGEFLQHEAYPPTRIG